MNQLNKEIGSIIRDHRQINHMSQLDLAKRLGYQSTQFVSLFERGISKCPIKVLGKICKILDIDPLVFKHMILKEMIRDLNSGLGIK